MLSSGSTTDWIVAIGTVAALLLAVWQLRENSRLASQSAAKQMWMEYVRIGLENPDLGETRIALKYLKQTNVESLISGDSLESQRYLWFLTVMLDASENLYLHFHTVQWERTISENLKYHQPALALLWIKEKVYYNDNFSKLVVSVI